MTSGKISLSSIMSIPSYVAFHDLAGEAVLLNMESGKYYGLDEVGTRMYALIKEHGRLDTVAHALVQEYDIMEVQLQTDLIILVNDLLALGLLQDVA